jgi:hypothetical protein
MAELALYGWTGNPQIQIDRGLPGSVSEQHPTRALVVDADSRDRARALGTLDG